ncbi:MAG: hypothetical protein ACJAU5_000981 [Maricaulis maris]|jgi:hypothetical protein|uniref:DUF998 domain-containing protein n=1 Tax=Maricaulis maris (strain MCS10) TaxID=394221 RepID=Q0AKR1_MARMM|nr:MULTISPECIES: hypothetical protein [Maricaulis]ABI67132.1 hypothetical protein Mmar10_2851 [Maricaulis maris MCS10]MAC90000.1 hypothetical protein [Maricaulis sp.]
MIAFAITDALVVVGAFLGIYLLWPHRRDGKVRMIRFGLGFMAFAALIGVVRFASGQVTELAGLHGMATDFAGAAGLLLIATGLMLKTRAVKLDSGVTRYIRYGIPALVAFLMFFPGTTTLISLLPILALVIGLAASAMLTLHGQRPAGLVWLASFVLIGAVSLLIGGSRTESTLGITNWHIYHAALGLWAVMVGEATNRLMKR